VINNTDKYLDYGIGRELHCHEPGPLTAAKEM